MKVSVIGAGNVGATCAEYIALHSIASEVVILDIKENFAEGKALDLMQTATLNGFNTRITGTTNDYSKTAGSKVVVITSGIPERRIPSSSSAGVSNAGHRMRPAALYSRIEVSTLSCTSSRSSVCAIRLM